MAHHKISPVVRTRMAPSPTGWLHVGTARTALFNYLLARHYQGIFVLRIEDTDQERSRKEFEDDIIEQLSWLGITRDEFYRQSERLPIHRTYLEKLLGEKRAFYCAHTREELEAEHGAYINRKEAPRHLCSHRDEGRKEGIIRLRNDTADEIMFTDAVHGVIQFGSKLLGDISIARSLDSPLYNFVVVVDDAEMCITHVIRGEDHISNTPKQLLIQQALGFSPPLYAHVPLLLGTDRSKLSKRHGATAVRDYRAAGYMPEAMVNFLALLGWNPGTDQELFSLVDLVKEFSLEKVQKAGAIFNEEKLAWLNRTYMRNLSTEELVAKLTPFIEKTSGHVPSELLHRIAYAEKMRLSRFADIEERASLYITGPPIYEVSLLRWKGIEDYQEIQTHLSAVRTILCDIPENEFFTVNRLQEIIRPYAVSHVPGNVFWPLRVALSGKKDSPGPFEIMYVIGKEKTIKRIDNALQLVADINAQQ